jgi:hypothetical protein
MQSDIPSAGSGSGSLSSVEEVEAIVRRVLAEAPGKQYGGPMSSRSTSSGEMLSLKDFELPDDGSTFTVVTLPNEIKQGGEGEKGAVSREEGMFIFITITSPSKRRLISSIHRPLYLLCLS